MKIVLVTNIPNQYRVPLFNELAKLLKQKGAELKVIFGAGSYARRKNKVELSDCYFDYTILEDTGNRDGKMTYHGLWKQLRKEKPDKLVVSGFNLAIIKGLFYATFRKIPLILWTGSTEIGNQRTSGFKRIYRKGVVKCLNHFVAYSTLTKKYLVSLGAKEEQIEIIGNTVDTVFFEKEAENPLNATGKDEKKHLLCISYLNMAKNLPSLIERIAELAAQRNDFVLDIVGDGEQKEELMQIVKQKGIEERVVFHGFKQKAELPQYLAKSDVFLFQTGGDIWGLVLNEAMISGKACLVSANAGAAYDLIEHGQNGYVVDFEEAKSCLPIINHLMDDKELRKRISIAAKRTIQEQYSLHQVAERFKTALIT